MRKWIDKSNSTPVFNTWCHALPRGYKGFTTFLHPYVAKFFSATPAVRAISSSDEAITVPARTNMHITMETSRRPESHRLWVAILIERSRLWQLGAGRLKGTWCFHHPNLRRDWGPFTGSHYGHKSFSKVWSARNVWLHTSLTSNNQLQTKYM